MRNPRRKLQRVRKSVAAGLGVLLAASLLTVPQAALGAGPSAVLTVEKTASTYRVAPGQEFTYDVAIDCAVVSADGCVDAVFSDAVPDEFEIVTASVEGATPQPTVDGQLVTVPFDVSLEDGARGLPGGANVKVSINVKLRQDVPHQAAGIEIPNTATLAAANAESVESTANVVPDIPGSSRMRV